MNGSMVKNHISLKTGFEHNATRKTSFLLWFQACQIRLLDLTHQLRGPLQDRGVITYSISSSLSSSPTASEIQTREREDRTESDISPVHVSTSVGERWGRTDVDQANKHPKTNQKEPTREQGDPLFTDSGRASSEIPEWLQVFGGYLVDDEIPEHGDSHASSSHEASLEPTTKRRTVFILIFFFVKTEIARSVRGPKLQVLKFLVT